VGATSYVVETGGRFCAYKLVCLYLKKLRYATADTGLVDTSYIFMRSIQARFK
jgi:hypothetical protein